MCLLTFKLVNKTPTCLHTRYLAEDMFSMTSLYKMKIDSMGILAEVVCKLYGTYQRYLPCRIVSPVAAAGPGLSEGKLSQLDHLWSGILQIGVLVTVSLIYSIYIYIGIKYDQNGITRYTW